MLSRDALQFKIELKPDDGPIMSVLANVGKQIDAMHADATKGIGDAIKAPVVSLGKGAAGIAQATSAKPPTPESPIAEVKAISTAEESRLKIIQRISEELDKQRGKLNEINAALDPKVLKERVALERQVAEATAKYEKAKSAEEYKQSAVGHFGQIYKEKGLGSALKGLFSDKGGPNLKEFLGQVAGGTSGGGLGGGMGAGIGSILGSIGGMFKGGGGGIGQMLGGMVGGGAGGGVGGAAGAGLGGMAAVAGGPIGIAAAAAPVVMKAIGSLAAAPVKIVSAGLGMVSSALSDLQGPLGPIGMGLNMLGGALKGVAGVIGSLPGLGKIFGPFADALAGLPGIIGGITQSLVGMAAKASPGIFKVWTMALEDVQGVIGQSFVPVLELMTKAVRLFGDILATILPSTQEMSAALAPLKEAWNRLSASLREVFAVIGPIIRGALITGIEALAEVMAFLADNSDVVMGAFTVLAGVIAAVVLPPLLALTGVLLTIMAPIVLLLSPLIAIGAVVGAVAYGLWKLVGGLKGVMSFLGMDTEKKGMRSSVGAAARPAEISGLLEYQKKLQMSAFGAGKGEDPAVQSAGFLGKILDVLGEIPSKIWSFFSKAIEGVWSGITSFGTTIWNALANTAKLIGAYVMQAVIPMVNGFIAALRKLPGLGDLSDVGMPGWAKEAIAGREDEEKAAGRERHVKALQQRFLEVPEEQRARHVQDTALGTSGEPRENVIQAAKNISAELGTSVETVLRADAINREKNERARNELIAKAISDRTGGVGFNPEVLRMMPKGIFDGFADMEMKKNDEENARIQLHVQREREWREQRDQNPDVNVNVQPQPAPARDPHDATEEARGRWQPE